MSYLTQNFYSNGVVTKVTNKTRSLWAVRNAYAVYMLGTSSLFYQLSLAQCPLLQFYCESIIGTKFNHFYQTVYRGIFRLRTQLLKTHFPVSAYYSSISGVESLILYRKAPTYHPFFGEVDVFDSAYAKHAPAVKILHANRPYRLALWKFMNMLTLLWFQWPRRYFLTEQYVLATRNWRMLRFLNLYYFKVYNV